jgi:RNA recognition motif-containing protein
MRTKAENKARGYGFVSFLDPMDCAKAIREMNGKYIASR